MFMKAYLSLLAILIMASSCQENKKENGDLDAIVIKEKTTQEKKVPKDVKSAEFPTEEQFEAFFPKTIGPYNRITVGVSKSAGIGSGTYIKGKDYGNLMTYYVTDGYRKGSSAIKNFEDAYQSNHKWPDGSERISKEQDGYKTVALLREKYNTYKISMLYNNRFELTVEGHEKPDELWSYLKQADLKILDSY